MGDAGWIARVGRDTPEIAASKLRSIRRLVLLMLATIPGSFLALTVEVGASYGQEDF